MIYNKLASYYDALVKDEYATKLWCDFTEKYAKGQKILELAAGSGEISYNLAVRGKKVLASDISLEMIAQAEYKFKHPNLKFIQLDMSNFHLSDKFDAIIVYCDSVNYLKDLDQFIEFIDCCYEHLKIGGRLLFDMHTEDRLKEFEESFFEDGYIDDTYYQWTITSLADEIHHHFVFIRDNEKFEEFHIQKVFALDDVLEILSRKNFNCNYMIDFGLEEFDGKEKYFIVGEKIC